MSYDICGLMDAQTMGSVFASLALSPNIKQGRNVAEGCSGDLQARTGILWILEDGHIASLYSCQDISLDAPKQW